MQTHAIVEIEEGGLNVVVAATVGDHTSVQRSLRVPVQDLGREALTQALRSLGSDVLQGASGVHVVLGERRMQHFATTVPRLSSDDMVAFVVRESLRLTNQPAPADVLVSTRILRRLPGHRHVLVTSALPRSAWEPVQAAFEANHIPVLGLYAMESCLALAAPAEAAAPVAVLECNGGRARFVLCDGQAPVQVRRFLVGAGESNPGALATQLSMELPRTFDWLREIGQPVPQAVVVGNRVPLDGEALDLLKGDELAFVTRAAVPVAVDEGLAAPGIGVAMLLDRLARGQRPASLLDAPALRGALVSPRRVALAAATAAGLACSWSAVVDGSAWLQVRDEVRAVVVQAAADEALLAGGTLPVAASDPAPLERQATALSTRRPVSQLIGQVANAADPTIVLEELRVASGDRMHVAGVVGGPSRRDALAALAGFSQRLRALPFLRLDGQDEVQEVPGRRNCFRFRLGMTWRNP